MIDYYYTIIENLSSLTTDLVKAFVAYKEATGKVTVKLHDCSGWSSNGPAKVDVVVDIDHLFVDDNGNICHNILF